MKDSPKEARIDLASEADLAIDFYDGHTLIEAFVESWVRINVDARGLDLVTSQEVERLVAQVAAAACVEHDARRQFVRT